jgi:hypothetical protein
VRLAADRGIHDRSPAGGDVTIVADTGMISVASQKAIVAAGLSLLGADLRGPLGRGGLAPAHLDTEVADGQVCVQPGLPDPSTNPVTRSSTTSTRPIGRGARFDQCE